MCHALPVSFAAKDALLLRDLGDAQKCDSFVAESMRRRPLAAMCTTFRFFAAIVIVCTTVSAVAHAGCEHAKTGSGECIDDKGHCPKSQAVARCSSTLSRAQGVCTFNDQKTQSVTPRDPRLRKINGKLPDACLVHWVARGWRANGCVVHIRLTITREIAVKKSKKSKTQLAFSMCFLKCTMEQQTRIVAPTFGQPAPKTRRSQVLGHSSGVGLHFFVKIHFHCLA